MNQLMRLCVPHVTMHHGMRLNGTQILKMFSTEKIENYLYFSVFGCIRKHLNFSSFEKVVPLMSYLFS